MNPQRILMIKSHSMGVGDVLRSSAAWRVLKNKWPDVELHLLFFSKHAGYATESLIQQHHLLSSAHFVTVRAHDPSVANAPGFRSTNCANRFKRLPVTSSLT